jgi:SAM-dependent methyltransferase
MGHVITLTQLRPEDRVLDVGCGSGRMAVPLTEYLTTGSYEGFDITADTVKWCQKKITPAFPNFRFRLVDVYNKTFNPNGSLRGSEFRFPCLEASFDVVFLASVFTHMLPADVDHYLAEIRRVLKPGGRCLATFFILTPESRELIREKPGPLTFRHDRDGCWINRRDFPEMAVAYSERAVREAFTKHGFALDPVHWGSWCGRKDFLSYQEIVVAH